MAKALRITPDEYYFFAKIVCEKAVKDGLSIVAKDKKNGKLIGFSISEDLESEPPEELENINEKYVCRRIVKNFYHVKTKESTMVEHTQEDLYLVFIYF